MKTRKGIIGLEKPLFHAFVAGEYRVMREDNLRHAKQAVSKSGLCYWIKMARENHRDMMEHLSRARKTLSAQQRKSA